MLKDYLPSNEAISSQGRSKLFKSMIGVVTAMRENVDSPTKLSENKKFLSNLILKELGMSVNVKISQSEDFNAWVYIPQLTGNNPLLIDIRKKTVKPKQARKLIKRNGGVISGTIDRVNSKLGGVYSELDHTVFITKGLLTGKVEGDYLFTPEMISGVILHELGHIFSYYEEVGGIVTTNYFLKTVAEGFDRNSGLLERHNVLDEVESLGKISFDSKEALAKESKTETVLTIVLTKLLEKNESDIGSKDKDVTSFEVRADQFATRHGAGPDLAKGLLLMEESNRTTVSILVRIRFIILFLLGGPLLILFNLVIRLLVTVMFKLIVSNVDHLNLYDKTKDRFVRMRVDLKAQLREGGLSKEETKEMLESIDSLEETIKQSTNSGGLADVIAYALSFSIRKKAKQLDLQQKLEDIANNELYVESARQTVYG